MPGTIKLSIVIPTYNEEDNIVELLEKSHEILEGLISHEFIIVDDQSKDKTREKIKQLQKKIPELRLIERNNERGLATALIAGYQAARGEYLGSMDADLASNPEYLPEMIRILEKGLVDFVIGSRYLPNSSFRGKPLINKITSIVGQWTVKLFLGIKATDTSNNYRIFKKRVWEKIKDSLHPEGNIMITEIVYLAEKNGFRIKEIPIIYIERRHGKSKLSIGKEIIRFLKNIWKIKYSK